jgi:hypothetical protein
VTELLALALAAGSCLPPPNKPFLNGAVSWETPQAASAPERQARAVMRSTALPKAAGTIVLKAPPEIAYMQAKVILNSGRLRILCDAHIVSAGQFLLEPLLELRHCVAIGSIRPVLYPISRISARIIAPSITRLAS